MNNYNIQSTDIVSDIKSYKKEYNELLTNNNMISSTDLISDLISYKNEDKELLTNNMISSTDLISDIISYENVQFSDFNLEHFFSGKDETINKSSIIIDKILNNINSAILTYYKLIKIIKFIY